MLCLFHDIGAYKTEEISRMLEFENLNMVYHSTYGYLFLKYFSPLGDMSKVILHHHDSYKKCEELEFEYRDYSNLIHLADRIDIGILKGMSLDKILSSLKIGQFDQEQVEILANNITEEEIREVMFGGNLYDEILPRLINYEMSIDEAMDYLRMMVFTIDFKSPYTMDHSIQTTQVSLFLANKLGLDPNQIKKLYFATLIHDIGKVAIPSDILEYPGKLTEGQMEIMRKHVQYTEELLSEAVSPEIMNMASRHHEKLNGRGYPRGLTELELTTEERIVAISDIFSALISKRSYKDKFDKEKTLKIMGDLIEDGSIDGDIVKHVFDNYEEIIEKITDTSEKLKGVYSSIKTEFDRI